MAEVETLAERHARALRHMDGLYRALVMMPCACYQRWEQTDDGKGGTTGRHVPMKCRRCRITEAHEASDFFCHNAIPEGRVTP